jgi:uncharacterized protein (TIGR00255 family)
MALISMTGFGRGEASRAGIRVEVELSAVNRKQLDVRVNLPRGLAALEAPLLLLIGKELSRGQVAVNARVTEAGGTGSPTIRVDRVAAAQGVQALREAARALGLPDRLGAEVLLQLPHVLVTRDLTEDPERVWPVLSAAVRRGLAALVAMRRHEGGRLAHDVRGRLRQLTALRRKIARRAPGVNRAFEAALRERLTRAGAAPDRRDPQLLKEVVLFADKSAVTEELVRLEAHVEHALELMRVNKPAGRALDFLCQEMFREINTIGSKCADGVIARCVVDFKAQLEAMREQIQNVE